MHLSLKFLLVRSDMRNTEMCSEMFSCENNFSEFMGVGEFSSPTPMYGDPHGMSIVWSFIYGLAKQSYFGPSLYILYAI